MDILTTYKKAFLQICYFITKYIQLFIYHLKRLLSNDKNKGVCCIGLCILIADHKYKVQLLHISFLSI